MEQDSIGEEARKIKVALENGETAINAVRQQYGLSSLKSGGADRQLKKLD